MRLVSSVIVAFFILCIADAAFTRGKYSQGVAAMGRSMAMHVGFR